MSLEFDAAYGPFVSLATDGRADFTVTCNNVAKLWVAHAALPKKPWLAKREIVGSWPCLEISDAQCVRVV
jgi:hypothetical protein